MTAGSPTRRSAGPLITGILVALLGYLIALAHGMSSAPSGWAGAMGTILFFLGCALAVLGLASIWVQRLRPIASTAMRVMIVVLVAGFVLEQFIAANSAG